MIQQDAGQPARPSSSDLRATEVESAARAIVQELAYGFSHEINNPLANIAARAQALLADEPHPERRKRLALIVSQAFRAHEMVAALAIAAKPPKLTRCVEDLVKVISRSVSELQKWANARDVRLTFSTDVERAETQVDSVAYATAIKELMINAIEASAASSEVIVTFVEGENEFTLHVRDFGAGISDRFRDRVFDSFFCGREAGRGLGMGLAKARIIAEGHGGRIGFENGRGENHSSGGATFWLAIPRKAT